MRKTVFSLFGFPLFLFAALTISPGSSAADGSLEITFLNAGYADAILISSPDGQNILLDSGDVTQPDLVADFLKSKGVNSLDLVIISHPHKNHFGAFFKVLDEIKVKEIVWNGDTHQEEPFSKLLKKIEEKQVPLKAVKEGDELNISDKLRFSVLHPGTEMTDNINHNALVLRMVYGKTSVLFTTDVGHKQQDALIEKYGEKIASDLVQVPHHGGPMSEQYIEFFKPKFFALSTGPNEWYLPHEEDVARLQAPVYRTDKHGNLVFQSNGASLHYRPAA